MYYTINGKRIPEIDSVTYTTQKEIRSPILDYHFKRVTMPEKVTKVFRWRREDGK